MKLVFGNEDEKELKEENSELFGTVSAEDEDAFNVARAAGTRNERNEAGIIGRVFFLQQSESFREIGDELIAAGQNDVMGWQDGKSASTRTAIGDKDASGLSDERVAFGDTGIAAFEVVDVVRFIGAANRKIQRASRIVREFAGVGADFFPAFAVTKVEKAFGEFVGAVDQVESRFEIGRILLEKGEARFEGFADQREPGAGRRRV